MDAIHGEMDVLYNGDWRALQARFGVFLKHHVVALIAASMTGDESEMRVLLAAAGAGAAVNSRHNGQTPLLCASAQGHTGVVRFLLAARAEVDAAVITGQTALLVAIHSGHLDLARMLLEAGAELPPRKRIRKQFPNAVEMWQLMGFHRHERRARAAAAPAAAAAEALLAEEEALLAEEEAEKSAAESRQAKAKRKKQRQKTKRAEAVPEPAQAGGGPALSGADPPSQCSDSQAASAATVATGVEEGQRAAAEQALEGDEGGVSYGAGRRASQASDGADERVGAEEEERGAIDPPPVMNVPAEEVLRALGAAGPGGEVGEGGFGKVFAAELPSLAARWGRVAVKCARGMYAADILLEVATLRLCHHRNVLLLLGYCDDARAPCMITPLMRGGSLDDRLQLLDSAFERLRRLGFEGDACLDWQRRLSALCDAARGLAHLHGERILHRDVKTANILLEGALRSLPMAHGPPLLVHRAVLSDVGLAKVREPTLDGTTTHATTRRLAFSTGFVDPALVNSN